MPWCASRTSAGCSSGLLSPMYTMYTCRKREAAQEAPGDWEAEPQDSGRSGSLTLLQEEGPSRSSSRKKPSRATMAAADELAGSSPVAGSKDEAVADGNRSGVV